MIFSYPHNQLQCIPFSAQAPIVRLTIHTTTCNSFRYPLNHLHWILLSLQIAYNLFHYYQNHLQFSPSFPKLHTMHSTIPSNTYNASQYPRKPPKIYSTLALTTYNVFHYYTITYNSFNSLLTTDNAFQYFLSHLQCISLFL